MERPGNTDGYDGVVNDYFLVPTPHFTPDGSLSSQALAAENITEFRWWRLDGIKTYHGDAVFSPRALGHLLGDLLHNGAPPEPHRLGL